jgi:hypothetical protein
MSEKKSTGRLLGEGLGAVIGEPIKFVGKKLNNTLITEIGEGVKKASAEAGETTGLLVGGTYNTAAGYIRKDDRLKQEGFQELADTATRTVKGVEHAIVQTWNHGEDVVTGFVKDDEERMIRGARGIVKATAIAALTVGVFEAIDAIDGLDDHVEAVELESSETPAIPSEGPAVNADSDHPGMVEADSAIVDSEDHSVETINADLEGTTHEETGVPFEKDTVTLPNGEIVSGIYPDFDEEYSMHISESMYLLSDDVQFSEANEQLSFEIQQNSELRAQFTPEQMAQIQAGETPDGYVWHHHQEPGRLELVNEQTHAQTGHSGGRSLWGGGSEYR